MRRNFIVASLRPGSYKPITFGRWVVDYKRKNEGIEKQQRTVVRPLLFVICSMSVRLNRNGAYGDRTRGLQIANLALSQLS